MMYQDTVKCPKCGMEFAIGVVFKKSETITYCHVGCKTLLCGCKFVVRYVIEPRRTGTFKEIE
jgi:ribosomal protein S27E